MIRNWCNENFRVNINWLVVTLVQLRTPYQCEMLNYICVCLFWPKLKMDTVRNFILKPSWFETGATRTSGWTSTDFVVTLVQLRTQYQCETLYYICVCLFWPKLKIHCEKFYFKAVMICNWCNENFRVNINWLRGQIGSTAYTVPVRDAKLHMRLLILA